MVQRYELSPQEAATRTLNFIRSGVTGEPDVDALVARRAEVIFGSEAERNEKQQAAFDRIGRTYQFGFLEMGRRLVGVLDDPSGTDPLPEKAKIRIMVFDPATER